MIKYTVRLNGVPVKDFTDKAEASKFMVNFLEVQKLQAYSIALVDEAVLKSDLKESKELLSYIMEKK